MKKGIAGFLLCSFAWSALAQAVLDNDGVLRMIRSGMKEDIIVSIINSQPGNYAATAESFAALRRAGASDRVIAAMMKSPNQAPVPVSYAPQDALRQQSQGTQAFAPPQDADDTLVVRDGTPIRLRLNHTLSSESVQTGDKIDFDVMDEIRSGRHIVIPRGTKAIGAITDAEHKRRMGRGGKIALTIKSITLADGTKVALRASQETKGGGHVGAMTAGIVATAFFVTLPAAPLFLLVHGKAATIPEATEMTAYVDGDVQIPLSNNHRTVSLP